MPLAASTPLLDDFLVVALRGKELELLYSFTGGTGEAAARTSAVKQFCFPDVEDTTSLSLQSESFTLTLTEDDGSRCFGFSRRLASLGDLHRPVCLCVLSRRPWFSLFMHMLDIAQRAGERAEHDCIGGFIPAFVAAATAARLPPPGGALAVSAGDFGSHRLYAPYDDERPTGVSFEPLLSALGVPNTVRLLGALLLEQRVIFVGSRWGHVSSCAHAALTLLYPLTWQHIFIPVLPTAMLSYACAPMPYVLGLLARHAPALAKEPVEEEVLYVHLETGKIAGGAEPSDEAPSLPRPISQALERSLGVHLRNGKKSRLDNQAVADAVLNLCMVQLLGHYRRCLAPPPPPAAPPARERRDGLHPRMDDEDLVCSAPALLARPSPEPSRTLRTGLLQRRAAVLAAVPARDALVAAARGIRTAARPLPPDFHAAVALHASEALPPLRPFCGCSHPPRALLGSLPCALTPPLSAVAPLAGVCPRVRRHVGREPKALRLRARVRRAARHGCRHAPLRTRRAAQPRGVGGGRCARQGGDGDQRRRAAVRARACKGGQGGDGGRGGGAAVGGQGGQGGAGERREMERARQQRAAEPAGQHE